MSTVVLNNSYCELQGFDSVTLSAVKTKLTYTDEEVIKQKAYLYNQIKRARGKFVYVLKQKFKDLGPDHVCWLDEHNRFPTGLLHLVQEVLRNFTVKDIRDKPDPEHTFRWNNQPSELRYYQTEAVDTFIQKGRGVLQMAVGSGKTRTAAEIIKQLGVNTLFVVPSTALLTQAHDVFELAFGSKNVQKITTLDMKKSKKLKPIRVVTIQTLNSINKNGLAKSLIGDVGLLILDECHHSGSDSFTRLLGEFSSIYYRLGLSGTYLRNDSKTLDLWGVCGQVVYDYNAAKATKEGYLTPVEFNMVKLRGKFSNNYQEEYKAAYGSLEFLESIRDLIKTTIPKKNQILILVERKESCGHLIEAFLKENSIGCTYVTGDSSKDEIRDAIEDFNDKKIRILLASTVLGEGCDLRSTDTLILARGGKSEIAITQAIGRAVRLYPDKIKAMVYDFNFRFCKYLPRHVELRVETYEKQFAGKINWLD